MDNMIENGEAPPEPKPETPKQAVAKAQYNAFRDYLERDLPEGPDKDRALASLAISYEAAYAAAGDDPE